MFFSNLLYGFMLFNQTVVSIRLLFKRTDIKEDL